MGTDGGPRAWAFLRRNPVYREASREASERPVFDGRLAGKSWRETAVDLYGADAVAAEWHADGWMRARVRRRGEKARMLMESGYRDLAAGW